MLHPPNKFAHSEGLFKTITLSPITISLHPKNHYLFIQTKNDDMAPLQLLLAICNPQPGEGTGHWILMLAEDRIRDVMWYHSTGGPAQGRPYKVEIEFKKYDGCDANAYHCLGVIPDECREEVEASAQKVDGKFSQKWVIDVLDDLEKKGLIAASTADRWIPAMEVDPSSSDGAQEEQTEARPSSASAVEQGQASNLPYPETDWVWDEGGQGYKYFDTDTERWLWPECETPPQLGDLGRLDAGQSGLPRGRGTW